MDDPLPLDLVATLTVPTRFMGPPGSGNGGWVAGRLAALFGSLAAAEGPVEVTLRQPPPLETPLDVRVEDGTARATFGGALVAEARSGSFTRDLVDAVPHQVALDVMRLYAGLDSHPFPGCFVCGVDRPAPDGLGLRPGRLGPLDGAEDDDTVATVWLVDESVAVDGMVGTEVVWAALDCPGGWSADLVGRPMVLGRMTAAVDVVPEVGERVVVVGRHDRAEGRKTFTSSTAYDADGRVLGRAEATWIAVDPARLAR